MYGFLNARMNHARWISVHFHSLQIDELKQAEYGRIFRDKVSGAKTACSGLQKAVDFLRDGVSLVFWRLDRLGRSLKPLLETVAF
jgi:DNA invertase Pin-like site-specific DNA recombinase